MTSRFAKSTLSAAVGCTAAWFVGSTSAAAQSVESFYAKQPVTINVGFSPGAGYDLYARILARHMGKHVPGKPNVLVVNMPGAGSLKAANYLYNIAPKDGASLAIFARGIPMEPLFGNAEARFDALKFNWIGSPAEEASVAFSWHESPIKTFEDVLSKEMIVSSTGSGADTATFPLLLNEVFKSKFKVIAGYPGAAEALIAVERKEADGMVVSWNTIKVPRPDWVRDKKINVLLQLNLEKNEELSGVPLAIDLVKNDADRKLLELFAGRLVMAYPVAAPPAVPAQRVAALRAAFDATMKDPQLLAEAERAGMDIKPVTGAKIQALLEAVHTSPQDVVERARGIIELGRKVK